MGFIFNQNIFMWLITGLFACSAVANLFVRDWKQVLYAVGAVMLNLAVISMAGK